jgi:succinate dehydrogenase/fumarate reductase flavoprotein subunit
VNNERAESSVPGLYVGGDEATKDISGAAVFGWIGGENAAARSARTPSLPLERERQTVEGMKSLIDNLQHRNQGPDWKDANLALQYTMADYAGLVRSETLLLAGLAHLRRLKEKVHRTLQAKNRWELSRCLEVVNLYDLGELVFLAALERKESRGLHNRTDYPYSDPLLNDRLLFIKKVDGKPVMEWRGVKRDR